MPRTRVSAHGQIRKHYSRLPGGVQNVTLPVFCSFWRSHMAVPCCQVGRGRAERTTGVSLWDLRRGALNYLGVVNCNCLANRERWLWTSFIECLARHTANGSNLVPVSLIVVDGRLLLDTRNVWTLSTAVAASSMSSCRHCHVTWRRRRCESFR